MRTLGLALITVGFLGGALFAVLDREVRWGGFVPFLVAGVAGVILAQVAIRRAAREVTRVEADFQTLEVRLRRIVQDVTALDEAKATTDVYDLSGRIDQGLPTEILAFVDARRTLGTAWGPQVYADVMSHFAAGERYLNRVWSTSVDGYVDEAHASLSRAREEFALALETFEAAKRASSPAMAGGISPRRGPRA